MKTESTFTPSYHHKIQLFYLLEMLSGSLKNSAGVIKITTVQAWPRLQKSQKTPDSIQLRETGVSNPDLWNYFTKFSWRERSYLISAIEAIGIGSSFQSLKGPFALFFLSIVSQAICTFQAPKTSNKNK